MKPKRVQRKRTKGFRMPENTVYVGRPTKYGNPWTVSGAREAGYVSDDDTLARHCVEAYRAWLTGKTHWAHMANMPPVPDLAPLRGKNLACWCKPGAPCHADVLLELANLPEVQP